MAREIFEGMFVSFFCISEVGIQKIDNFVRNLIFISIFREGNAWGDWRYCVFYFAIREKSVESWHYFSHVKLLIHVLIKRRVS